MPPKTGDSSRRGRSKSRSAPATRGTSRKPGKKAPSASAVVDDPTPQVIGVQHPSTPHVDVDATPLLDARVSPSSLTRRAMDDLPTQFEGVSVEDTPTPPDRGLIHDERDAEQKNKFLAWFQSMVDGAEAYGVRGYAEVEAVFVAMRLDVARINNVTLRSQTADPKLKVNHRILKKDISDETLRSDSDRANPPSPRDFQVSDQDNSHESSDREPTTNRPSQTPARERRRPRDSIFNEPNKDLKETVMDWLDRMKSLSDEAINGDFGDYEEVTAITTVFLKTQERIDAARRHKANNIGRDVKILTFSKATTEDLRRLNINVDTLQTIPLASLIKGIRQERTFANEELTHAVTMLQDRIGLAREMIGTKNEAGARMIINEYLFQAKEICRQNDQALTVRLELAIPSAEDPIVRGNYATFVSGILDYGMSSSGTFMSDKEFESLQSEIQTIEIVIKGHLLRETFVILEAKSDLKKLRAHLAQVIFQCVALPKEVTRSLSENVTFCLANSREWIFGAINTGETPELYTSDTLEVNEREGMKNVLELLSNWVSLKSDDIFNIMKELGNPQN
ncbi:hypothetical protein ONZ45_g11293 [Pleurotus djamor]|nr:hypothetical protein ONZ45_g11293 [Pleurotus djamor]